MIMDKCKLLFRSKDTEYYGIDDEYMGLSKIEVYWYLCVTINNIKVSCKYTERV